MIWLMAIIVCAARAVRCDPRDVYRLLAPFDFFSARSGYGDGKTTACVGSVFTAYDLARLADSCISGTSYFGVPVLAVDHRNTHTPHKPCHRMVIKPDCRPPVGLSRSTVFIKSDCRRFLARGCGIYGTMASIITWTMVSSLTDHQRSICLHQPLAFPYDELDPLSCVGRGPDYSDP